MKYIMMTGLLFILGLAAYAQQNNPEDLGAIDKPSPPPARKITEEMPEKVFTDVEVMPEYPGGTSALLAYLNSNIRYPEAAKKNNIQGQVVLKFIVDKTGDVINVTLFRSVDPAIDEEALRVVRAMPRWKPGITKNGEPIKVYYTLPISFSLSR